MDRTLLKRPRKFKPRHKALKTRLQRAGVTFDEVARFAGVSYRMVQYVVDGQRTSAIVMAAIDRLAPEPAA